jgi:uncharacterized membrane protein
VILFLVTKPKRADLHQELLTQKNEIDDINYKIDNLKSALLDRYPKHFSLRNVVDSFFAALIVGLTFVLKGATVDVAEALEPLNVILILIVTVIIIVLQIYFVSYSRVQHKEERPAFPFIAKRMLSILIVSFVVAVGLVYLLAIPKLLVNPLSICNVIILLTSICAIGSAIPGLMLKY